MTDYRSMYKRYYGIDFGPDYIIHHIDLDRTNNDISNLLLLPKELHAKYHTILNAISVSIGKPKADGFVDLRLSNLEVTQYCFDMFALLPAVIAECQKWIEYKRERYQMFGRVEDGGIRKRF